MRESVKNHKILAAVGSRGHAHKVSALPCSSSPLLPAHPTDTVADVHEPKGVGDSVKTDCPLWTPGDACRYSDGARRLQTGFLQTAFYLPVAADLHVAKPWSWEKNINKFKWAEMQKTSVLGDVQL